MKKQANYYFLALVFVLLMFGLLFLTTVSSISSLQAFGKTNYYLFHQLSAIGIGLVLGLCAYKINLNFLRKISPVLLGINLLLVTIAVLPFLGTKFWGASRWISIGNHTFQPSEFLKITSILYLSAWLSSKFSEASGSGWTGAAKKGYRDFIRIFLFFLALIGIITVILYLQKDIGTLGIIIIALLSIYFAAGTPLWHTASIFCMGIAGVAIMIIKEPYRIGRLLTFLHPETDPLGQGFQLKQSLIAIGSGGSYGKGLGMSTQKFGFLPQAMSDFIFSILGEELGIIGGIALISLFLGFLYLGFSIANSTKDKFYKLTAIGLTVWIVTQAFINIASATGIFPLVGIPLPFFSYGGSHLMAELMAAGLLLNISKHG